MGTNFTAKEKVLVHLLDHYGNEEGYALPVEITQEGIANSLGLKQNTVSYAVRNLVKEGLLREETRRIKDKKQKRKAYFLTDNGFEKAKKTREGMANTEVDVKSEQEKSPIKLGEINAYFQTNHSVLDIIQKIEEDGHFEPEEISKDESFVSHLNHLPVVGQEKHPQFSELLNIWEDGERLITIVGDRGSGRTTLLSEMADELEGKNNIFYFAVRGWQEETHLWRALAEFLENCGNHKLSSYLKSEKVEDRKERLTHLMKDLKDMRTVFMADDAHKNEAVSQIFRKIASLDDKEGLHRFIISTASEDLDPIGSGGVELRLPSKNLLISSLEEFYDQGRRVDSIDDVLDKYITDEEFWALGMLSIFRIPVEKEALSRIEPVTSGMVKNLIDTPLIYLTKENKVGTHDLIRDKIMGYLSISQRLRLHGVASDYYMEKPTVKGEYIIEKINHLVSSRRYDTFEEKLKEEWEEILAMGYSDSIIDLIDEVDEEHIVPHLNYIKGRAQEKKKEYSKAENSYLQVIDSNEDDELITQAHLGLASTLERKEKYKEALSEYECALNAAEAIEDKDKKNRCMGRVFFRMGALLSERGEYTPAEDYLSNAIDILEDDEHSLLTTAYFVIAKIKKLQGDWDSSISYFEEGLKHWKKIKETYQRVGGLEEIGSFYTILRELNSAEEYLKEAIEASERFGYRDLKASALISLAECYLEKRMVEEAIDTGEKAKELMEEMDDEKREALAHTLLGNAYTIMDDIEEAEKHYNRSISIYQKIGASYRLGLAYFSMAKLQEKKGNKDGLAENYRKAILSFSGSGANWMAEKVEKKMEGIPISI